MAIAMLTTMRETFIASDEKFIRISLVIAVVAFYYANQKVFHEYSLRNDHRASFFLQFDIFIIYLIIIHIVLHTNKSTNKFFWCEIHNSFLFFKLCNRN